MLLSIKVVLVVDVVGVLVELLVVVSIVWQSAPEKPSSQRQELFKQIPLSLHSTSQPVPL
jgi:hypothetical protein